MDMSRKSSSVTSTQFCSTCAPTWGSATERCSEAMASIRDAGATEMARSGARHQQPCICGLLAVANADGHRREPYADGSRSDTVVAKEARGTGAGVLPSQQQQQQQPAAANEHVAEWDDAGPRYHSNQGQMSPQLESFYLSDRREDEPNVLMSSGWSQLRGAVHAYGDDDEEDGNDGTRPLTPRTPEDRHAARIERRLRQMTRAFSLSRPSEGAEARPWSPSRN